jgi:hypothetical protein
MKEMDRAEKMTEGDREESLREGDGWRRGGGRVREWKRRSEAEEGHGVTSRNGHETQYVSASTVVTEHAVRTNRHTYRLAGFIAAA